MQAENPNSEEILAPLTPLTQIRDALHEEDWQEVSDIVNELAPAEIARMLESLPPTEREQVWENVDDEYNGEVLAHLSESVLEDLVDEMSAEELLQSAESMDEDDLVDFLQDVPEEVAVKLLSALDEEQRNRLEQILEYDEDSAGGMMNTDAISVRPDTHVETVIRYLRHMDELPDITNKIFVVDRDEQLLGEVILTRLLTANNEQRIADIMDKEPVTLHLSAEGQQVARIFREQDLISVAVVNDANQLVGRITVDDVMDYIQAESERLLLQTAGMDEEVDTFAPIRKAAIGRGIWLGVNMLTALITASVINAFGGTIEQIVALAALAPVVASLGGNAGSQSLTIIIRGIALGQIEGANTKSLIFRELLIGMISGLVWGSVAAVIAYLWFHDGALALVMFSALFLNLIAAAFVGVVTPLILNRLKIDPALAGSIFLMTFTDIIGFLALLGLATVFLL